MNVLQLGLSIGPEIVIIAAVLLVTLPAFSEQYSDPYIAGMAAYLTFIFLSIETNLGLFRTIAYILVPLSFIYASFIAYGEITGDGGGEPA